MTLRQQWLAKLDETLHKSRQKRRDSKDHVDVLDTEFLAVDENRGYNPYDNPGVAKSADDAKRDRKSRDSSVKKQ